MKHLKSKLALSILFLLLSFTFFACNEENSILESDLSSNTDQSELLKLVDQDETLSSFDINYDEEDVAGYVLGKTAENIFPLKVGQKMKLVNRELNVVFEGDTAYGTLIKDFEGVLFIAASKDSIKNIFDSVDLDIYEKFFSTTITRNLIFVKNTNSDSISNSWRLASISLPAGGTLTENVDIENLTVYLPSGEIISIDDPLNYFLEKGYGFRHMIPQIRKHETVTVEVEIKTVYEDLDFVTLTHGAIRDAKHLRAKKRFEYVDGSETFDGTYFHRTYTGTWRVNNMPGYRHAVINVIPYNVIYDSEAPVESKSWGIPYKVN